MASKLCSACGAVTLSMLVNGFKHPLDYDRVAQSKDYCRLCSIVHDAYKSQKCIKYDKTQACVAGHRGPLLWRVVESEHGVRSGMFRLDQRHYGELHRLSVSEESSVFLNRIITQRDTQIANSPRNMRLLREWLGDCELHHGECRQGTLSGNMYDDSSPSTTLPFRVIDIGIGEKKPRVYTTNGKETGRYLTLSHCWGKVIPPRMTKKTLGSWQLLLPEADLPKTFRDAIWLTRELGERFLWIDSICIVQDDPSELRTQIGLMGNLFEQSLCTIAAVDAKGSDGSQVVDSGLFVSGPDHGKAARLKVKASITTSDSLGDSIMGTCQNSSEKHETQELCEVVIQEAGNTKFTFRLQLEDKAWNSRGWVFQERKLSRRCIFFTESELGWRCNRYWETEQTGIPECRKPHGDFFLERSTASGGVSSDAQCNLRRLWQITVEQYSVTKLTYNSDKHNAIMGLEERLATRFGCKFHQGIIDFGQCEHLHMQLLWVPVISRGGLNDIQFPCWSWMNISGAVTWPHDEYLVFPELLAQIEFSQPTSKETMQGLHISGMFPSIRVGHRLGDIPYHEQHERWTPDTHFGWSELGMHPDTNTLLSAKEDRIIGWVVLDAPHEPGDMFALPLLKNLRQDDEEEPMCVDFLAVCGSFPRPDSTSLEYKGICHRVGRGRVLKSVSNWLDCCWSSNIVLR